MRTRLLALLLLPAALTGCPALLTDWTIAGGPTDDASPDARGHDAAGDSSSGPSGSPDASIDVDAGSSPAAKADADTDTGTDAGGRDGGLVSSIGDAWTPDVSPSADDASDVDAGPCGDDGPLYLHQVGLLGLTWQDCMPTGTYNATQALAACAAYALAVGAEAASCSVNAEPMGPVCGSTVTLAWGGTLVAWLYEASGEQKGAVGHVSTGGGCPVMQDPEWD